MIAYRWADTKAAPLLEVKYVAWVQAQSPEWLDCTLEGDIPWADRPFQEIVRLVMYANGKRALSARHWRLHRMLIRGIDYSSYHLEYFCDVRIRKDGSLGAYRGENYDSRLLSDAYGAWVQAGKPDEFTFVS